MHKVILINAASNRTEHEFATIEEAAGSCGYKMPLIFDGRAGYFEFVAVDSTKVRFVETCEDLQQFRYAHLPSHVQHVSFWFYHVAEMMFFELPDCRQRDVAMLDLLRAKDAAVRARLTK